MKGRKIFSYSILILFSIMMGFPFFYLVSLSLQSSQEAMRIPPTFLPAIPRFINYPKVLSRAPLLLYLRNSFIFAGLTTLGVLITASLASYALTKLRFPGRSFWTLAFIFTILLPPAVRIVPLYTFIAKLGWVNTWQGLILPLTMTGFTVFFMRQYLIQIPSEPIEAAKIDGASEIKIFLQIIMPLCRPVIGTVALLNFIFRWNGFLWPLVMTHGKNVPLTVGLASFQSSEQFVSWNIVAVAAMFLTIPSLLLFLFMQKYIIRGIAIGVGK